MGVSAQRAARVHYKHRLWTCCFFSRGGRKKNHEVEQFANSAEKKLCVFWWREKETGGTNALKARIFFWNRLRRLPDRLWWCVSARFHVKQHLFWGKLWLLISVSLSLILACSLRSNAHSAPTEESFEKSFEWHSKGKHGCFERKQLVRCILQVLNVFLETNKRKTTLQLISFGSIYQQSAFYAHLWCRRSETEPWKRTM